MVLMGAYVLVVYGTKELRPKLETAGADFVKHVRRKTPDFKLFTVVVHRTTESHPGILSNPYYRLRITKVELIAISPDAPSETLYSAP